MKSLKEKYFSSKKHLILYFSILLLLLSFPVRFFLISRQKEKTYNKEYSPRLKAVETFINKSQKDKNNLKSTDNKGKNLEKVAEYEYFYQKGTSAYQMGKLADAADNLEKALKIKDTVEIKDMTSQVYNLLGMKEIESRNYDKAIEFFDKSFNILNNFQSLLGIYNAHILKGDLDKALSTLVKTSELYPKNAEVYFNLAQIYYQKGDVEKAVAYWKKAQELNPGDIKSETALKRVRADLGVDESLLKKGDNNFIFELSGTPNSFSKDIILTLLQQSFEKIEKDLNILPTDKIKIILDFDTMFNLQDQNPNKNIIIDKNKIKIPVSEFKKSSEQMGKAILYSYTKFIISDYTNRRCPVWFAEGLSLYESGVDNTFYSILIRNMVGSGKFIKLEALNLPFQNLEKRYVPLAYALSAAAIDMIINKYGFSSLRELLEKIKGGESFENEIVSAFKLYQNDFQKIFESYLKEKYKI
ncbi:MAG: hypothetical protein A2W05_02810 [Candidatus Schekmanbacteria bacterium RBG_16_38_10]|uniref:Peptidase MA-like domain-containing protein n=1 Tax=Candidatus Schekmanbacteria bacterium RBG_16_38_10 TaxID=1817879 RepID=A0A1F7S2C3_9BACT|nr:MAG: hypothetical protein A2W05_02810 [Candidatus Schekmanbacteria bacterium RBG_16_38_10]